MVEATYTSAVQCPPTICQQHCGGADQRGGEHGHLPQKTISVEVEPTEHPPHRLSLLRRQEQRHLQSVPGQRSRFRPLPAGIWGAGHRRLERGVPVGLRVEGESLPGQHLRPVSAVSAVCPLRWHHLDFHVAQGVQELRIDEENVVKIFFSLQK